MSIANLVDGVHHTALSVRNYEAMRAFFVDFIGFEVTDEMAERGEPEFSVVVGMPGARCRWGMMRLGSHRVELFCYFNPEGGAVPPAQCDTAFTHLAFETNNVDEVHRRAIAAGYEAVSEPQTMRGGAVKVFYLRGPEGVIVEFMEFPQK